MLQWQILEAEGVAVPEEVPCILQVVSEYLKEPCPITTLSGSQGPIHAEGLKHSHGDKGEGKGRRDAHQVNLSHEVSVVLESPLLLQAPPTGRVWAGTRSSG